MCGICGYMSNQLVSHDNLVRMNDTIIYRGPDDSGYWEEKSSKGLNIGLAQRRLSILDLSAAGHQPMLSADGKAVIVYNGEIYNFLELKEELIKAGFSFKSSCDTEVLLAAYRHWGVDAFSRFNGMFAFVIYDMEKDELIMARDKIGKKPLYYYIKDNTFIFASELKPIIACPLFDKEINQDALGQFFVHKSIYAPNTIFKNTYKMAPGTYGVYKNGQLAVNKYWDIVELRNSTPITIHSLDTAKHELDDLLTDAVAKRLIADVPVGTFLSGGIDSSLVTAIASKVLGRPVDTFTIGFDDKERNEAPQAAAIAAHLGTNHHELYITEEDLFALVDDMPRYYDEPFADASLIPTMLVSRLAKENVTVALSGDAGDEIFCGYTNYDREKIAQMVDWMGAVQYALPWNKAIENKFPPSLRAFVNNRDRNYKSQLFNGVFLEEANKIMKNSPQTSVYCDAEGLLNTNDFQQRKMIVDFLTYLPDEVLVKTDRASMKYSLEVRCPLCDHRIVEWALGLDHKLKYHGKEKKYILKQLAYEYIPPELLDMPKRGFGVPMKKWLRNQLSADITKLADRDLIEAQGIFDYEGLMKLIQKQKIADGAQYTNTLFGFYVFQRWYEEYIS